jgi:hypothetical protein
LGVTSQISLTGRHVIKTNGQLLSSTDLSLYENENVFLKIIVNNENKLIRI